MTRKPPSISFHFESDLWDQKATEVLANKILDVATPVLEKNFDHDELSLVLSDDNFIADLNHRFRGKSGPTNVLSFPDDSDGYLGDIILSYETIKMEADQQNKRFDDHLQHMILHGFLHLLGYDHNTDQEAEEMESLEILVLKTVGIENPYEERTLC